MSLYEGAVKRPIMTSLAFLAVAIFGLFSLSRLPIDLLPDIETNTIMVMTSYQGASASDIENNVTRPLENTLNSVENLKHITSKSSEGISVITLEFEFGNDIDVLTNDVRDKLDMVTSMLPDEPSGQPSLVAGPNSVGHLSIPLQVFSMNHSFLILSSSAAFSK